MPKKISITVQAEVADEISEEQVAERLQEALKGYEREAMSLQNIKIQVLPKEGGAAADGPRGYESRAFDKSIIKW